MTDPEPAPSCQVSFLVPHPDRLAILVADDGPRARLPAVSLANPEPLISETLAAADFLDGDATIVLRQVTTSSGDEDKVTLLVECDAYRAAPAPGWTWLDLDAQLIARLKPETSRAAVASWARERAEGWSPLRPSFSRPGWFARASAWMVDQMAAAGRPVLSPPRQHQLWGMSAILRAPVADGDVYFKCPTEHLRTEAAVTHALAGMLPDVMPEVLAVDEAEGWLLLRDLGAPELGEQDESLWIHGVVALARIQQAMTSRTDELTLLGLPTRPLAGLAAMVEEINEDTALLERMPADLRNRWLATSPALIEACIRLDAIGPGMTLVHGDFHPWNVVHGPAITRVFDWSDAALSHPFLDLATYVFRTEDISIRRDLLEAYIAAWSSEGSDDSLREAAALGLVVGALYQVQTYRALLPTLMANGGDDDLADADLDWINRTLTRHEQGLESPN